MKIRLGVLAIALVAIVGGFLTQMPKAFAVQQGLCMTNYASTCARETSPYVDSWPQDISGDSYQDYARTYEGQVSVNWPSTKSWEQAYIGSSVWELYNIATLNCISVYGYQNQANARSCGNFTDELFIWTSTGAMVNVYQSDYYNAPQFLEGQGAGSCVVYDYVPLVTWNGGCGGIATTWTMRNGS